jgi:RNA polymerase sigma-70 factor (sigma-E family)
MATFGALRERVNRGGGDMHEPDRVEFTTFVYGQAPSLRRIAYGLVGNWPDADDLVQITFERAFVNWSKVRGAEDPSAYLRTILINKAMSEFRRPWRRRESPAGRFPEQPPPDDVGQAAPDPARQAGERVDLARALGGLGPRHRLVVLLRYLEDRTVADVAAIMRCPEGTVKRLTHEAVRRMRSYLAEGPDPLGVRDD